MNFCIFSFKFSDRGNVLQDPQYFPAYGTDEAIAPRTAAPRIVQREEQRDFPAYAVRGEYEDESGWIPYSDSTDFPGVKQEYDTDYSIDSPKEDGVNEFQIVSITEIAYENDEDREQSRINSLLRKTTCKYKPKYGSQTKSLRLLKERLNIELKKRREENEEKERGTGSGSGGQEEMKTDNIPKNLQQDAGQINDLVYVGQLCGLGNVGQPSGLGNVGQPSGLGNVGQPSGPGNVGQPSGLRTEAEESKGRKPEACNLKLESEEWRKAFRHVAKKVKWRKHEAYKSQERRKEWPSALRDVHVAQEEHAEQMERRQNPSAHGTVTLEANMHYPLPLISCMEQATSENVNAKKKARGSGLMTALGTGAQKKTPTLVGYVEPKRRRLNPIAHGKVTKKTNLINRTACRVGVQQATGNTAVLGSAEKKTSGNGLVVRGNEVPKTNERPTVLGSGTPKACGEGPSSFRSGTQKTRSLVGVEQKGKSPYPSVNENLFLKATMKDTFTCRSGAEKATDESFVLQNAEKKISRNNPIALGSVAPEVKEEQPTTCGIESREANAERPSVIRAGTQEASTCRKRTVFLRVLKRNLNSKMNEERSRIEKQIHGGNDKLHIKETHSHRKEGVDSSFGLSVKREFCETEKENSSFNLHGDENAAKIKLPQTQMQSTDSLG